MGTLFLFHKNSFIRTLTFAFAVKFFYTTMNSKSGHGNLIKIDSLILEMIVLKKGQEPKLTTIVVNIG